MAYLNKLSAYRRGIDITEPKKNQQKFLLLSQAVASISDAIASADLSGNPSLRPQSIGEITIEMTRIEMTIF